MRCVCVRTCAEFLLLKFTGQYSGFSKIIYHFFEFTSSALVGANICIRLSTSEMIMFGVARISLRTRYV